MVENPKGNDSGERKLCHDLCLKSKLAYEERFKTSRKYRDDPEIQALLNPVSSKKEVKKNAK